MDLTAFSKATPEGEWLHFLHPATGAPLTTEDGKPVRGRFLGKDSDVYRKSSDARQNARLKAAARTQNLFKGTDAEALRQEGCELLAAVAVEFENVEFEGKPVLAGDKPTVTKMLLRVEWLREQVAEFIEDRSNFLAK